MRIEDLLPKHRKNNYTQNPKKLTFEGVAPKDVYNVSSPFQFENKTFILGRVESRDSEYSEACFFEKIKADYYILDLNAPSFNLQDPFYTFIEDFIIIGGVEVKEKKENSKELEWRTVLYKGTSLKTMECFFKGPIGMKDLRIKGLKDGRILVLTRPQGLKGGRGKIGATLLSSLSELTIKAVNEAPLLKEQFIDEEWGGANEIHQLTEKIVGVLGHIANFDPDGNRHYYAMTFKLLLDDFSVTDSQIIAERKDFLPGPSKRADLEDVVFSGGLSIYESEAILYAGISDAEAQKIVIKNPFLGEV